MPDVVTAFRPLGAVLGAMLGTVLAALAVLAGGLPGEAGALTGAVAVLAAVLALVAAAPTGALAAPVVPPPGHGRTAAERADREGLPRQVHPDAAGHRRPRAPGRRAAARPS